MIAKKVLSTILLAFSAFIAVQAAPQIPASGDLETLIGEKYEIFSVNRPRFITRSNQYFFRWTSDEKTEARYPAYRNSPPLRYFGFDVEEVIVRFTENTLSSIYVSVYNRGDAGEMPYDKFDKLVTDFSEAVSKYTKTPVPEIKKDKLANKMQVCGRIWIAGEYTYIMKWSTSGKAKAQRPEYLQVEIEPYSKSDDPSKRSLTKVERKNIQSDKSLASNVRKDEKGNVWIEGIPMVDQGQKGYCVVAVIERILRYYGADVNQHTLAQLASSSAQNGTSAEAMKAALKKAGTKLAVNVRDRYNLIENFKDVTKLISKYNSAAKKAKASKVGMVEVNAGGQRMIDLAATLGAMDPDIYQKMRVDDKSGMKNFMNDIHSRIAKGLPIAWSVRLGVVPEDGLPQIGGGHMRMIIGYNDKNGEIIYTDSWGAGHEKKSMPVEDAWTITMGTTYIDPRN